MSEAVEALWNRLNERQRLLVIAGPCVVESEKLCFEVASRLQEISRQLGFTYVFKASYDKANRTSARSYRGPGLVSGLKILARVGREFGLPLLTDVHTEDQARAAA